MVNRNWLFKNKAESNTINSLLKERQMTKVKKTFEGKLDRFPKHKIYLNVNHLEKGEYTLKIIFKNKVIKKTTFKK